MGDFYGINSFMKDDPKAFRNALGEHKEVRFHGITLDEYDKIERDAPVLIGLRRGHAGKIWHVLHKGHGSLIADEDRATWSGVSGQVGELVSRGGVSPASPGQLVAAELDPEYEMAVLLARHEQGRVLFNPEEHGIKPPCVGVIGVGFSHRGTPVFLFERGYCGPREMQWFFQDRASTAKLFDTLRAFPVKAPAPESEQALRAIRAGCEGADFNPDVTEAVLAEFRSLATNPAPSPDTMWGDAADLECRPWEFYEEVLDLPNVPDGAKHSLYALAKKAGSPNWLMCVLARRPVEDAADAAFALRLAAEGHDVEGGAVEALAEYSGASGEEAIQSLEVAIGFESGRIASKGQKV